MPLYVMKIKGKTSTYNSQKAAEKARGKGKAKIVPYYSSSEVQVLTDEAARQAVKKYVTGNPNSD